jgi:hypothetical protein
MSAARPFLTRLRLLVWCGMFQFPTSIFVCAHNSIFQPSESCVASVRRWFLTWELVRPERPGPQASAKPAVI